MKHAYNRPRLTRRQFCALSAGGIIGAIGSAASPTLNAQPESAPAASPPNPPPTPSAAPTVALARDPSIWEGEGVKINPAALRRLLDRALCLALGQDDPLRAWQSIIQPADVVGIKVNCLGGRTIATRIELAQAVVDSLLQAGVPAGNIIIWERSDRDLEAGGYTVQKSPGQVRCMGSPGLAPQTLTVAGVETRLSILAAEACTALINLAALKTHGMAGFSGALKNNMGAIPNPGKLHPDACLAVADLNALAPLRGKTRLAILDALRPLYNEGPMDHPAYRYKFHALIAGTDSVAVDRVGLACLEEKRASVRSGSWPLQPLPLYLRRAGELGLGQADLTRINVVREERS